MFEVSFGKLHQFERIHKGEDMNFRLLKLSSIVISSILIFNGCESDKNEGPKLGDIVGTWDITALTGTYTRDVSLPASYPADTVFKLTASWKDGSTVLGALASVADLTMLELEDGDAAPGFPVTAAYDAAGLTTYGIAMTAVFEDASTKGGTGTYKLNGTYPTIRLDEANCESYSTVAQIADQGDYTVEYDATGNGTLAISPDINLGDQVLPPFDDGTVEFGVDAKSLTLKFLDRDSHDSRYTEIMDSWSETDNRVNQGINALPIDATTGAFGLTGDLATEGYVMDAKLAAWGGYMTFYALAINVETAAKVTDVKNPLTDLDNSGSIDATDMIIYMHADNLASAGSVSQLGVPYAMLVDSSDPTTPVPVNDSADDFDVANAGTGGKLTYEINGMCFPINELIDFDTDWDRVE